MLRAIGIKILLLIPVLFLVSLGTFMLVELVPGDPAIQVLGPNSTQEEYYRIRTEMGLDKPIVERYVDWLGDAAHGDLGRNLVPPVEDVWTRLRRAFPVNIELAVLALLMAFAISLPLAMWSAYRSGTRFDRMVSASMFGLISVPSVLAGILLLLIFAINWRFFPLGQWARPTEKGWGTNLKHAFLPALTLALNETAVFTRLLRSDMISTLQEDYILAAKAKGMPTRHILLREALRPSSFSLITLAGVSLGRLIGGTVIVEGVFALPGVGRTVIDAATKSDYKLVQGGVLIIAVIYIALNLFVDIMYSYLDPRIRRGRI
ncbi:MAG TPA: ABC transporter permease [Acidimicrobiales bacterium]|nr:ABC transporter permease [Acidimicrobiales bacterium]